MRSTGAMSGTATTLQPAGPILRLRPDKKSPRPLPRGFSYKAVQAYLRSYQAAACGVSERRFLRFSKSLPPHNTPPTARRTKKPLPISGAGTTAFPGVFHEAKSIWYVLVVLLGIPVPPDQV